MPKLPYHYLERRTEIFWTFVNKQTDNGCWEWTGYIRPDGYGGFCGKPAQWYSWKLVHGSLPEAKEICHTCDNRKCINPEHLWEGTHYQNMRDAAAKGRMGRGRIYAHLDAEIKQLIAEGKTHAKISSLLKVSEAHISHIRNNKRRKTVNAKS